MIKHKHHIKPRYLGGTDDNENLIEVTVTQHAMFHYCNWRLWGNEQDRIAWRALSGIITCEDAVHESLKLGAKIRNSLPCKETTKQKLSVSAKNTWNSLTEIEKSNKLRGFWKGTPIEKKEEISKKIQQSKGTPVICVNHNTNEVTEFPSLQSARKHYGIGMSTIRKLVLDSNKIYNGISVKYKN